MTDWPGGPSATRELSRPGIVAGIGLRGQASFADLLDLLDASLAAAGLVRADIVALATLDGRSQHPALGALARHLAVPVNGIAPRDLAPGAPNPSALVAGLAQVASVAEAAARRFGPLVLEKQRGPSATCALARYAPAESGIRSRASMAAATSATSSAGP